MVIKLSSGVQFMCGVGECESGIAERDICEDHCERREQFEVKPTAEQMGPNDLAPMPSSPWAARK